MKHILILLSFSFTLVACFEEESESTSDLVRGSTSTNFCTYEEIDTYQMGSFRDLTQDFSSLYIDIDVEITKSNCEGLATGSYGTVEAHQVNRIGDKLGIVMVDDVDLGVISLNGDNLVSEESTFCSDGVEIHSIRTGSFDNVNKLIKIKFNNSVTANGCADSSPEVNPVFVSGLGDSIDFDEYSGATALYFNSEWGDYIGAGKTRLYTDELGKYSATTSGDGNTVRLSFDGLDGIWFTIDLAAANGQELAMGVYLNATRSPFNAADENGFDFSGDGRGCNNLEANFTIHEIEFDIDYTLLKLNLDFEQRCDNSSGLLKGTVRYNATDTRLM